jgi:hypothetical protein
VLVDEIKSRTPIQRPWPSSAQQPQASDMVSEVDIMP